MCWTTILVEFTTLIRDDPNRCELIRMRRNSVPEHSGRSLIIRTRLTHKK